MPDKMPEGPPPQPTFLTYISDRTPEYKHHKNLGQAKNAVSYGGYRWTRGGQIWEWQDTSALEEYDKFEWVLLYDIKRGTPQDDLPWNAEKVARRIARERARERAKLEERLKELDGL